MIYILFVLYILFFYMYGMLDCHRDMAKATMQKWIDPELFAKYHFYFESGNGKAGWLFKHKNGDNKQGEAFKYSYTLGVWRTDWFHFVKKIQFILLSWIVLDLLLIGYFMNGYPLYYWVFIIIPFTPELINSQGFNAIYYNNSKVLYFLQKIGLNVFLKTMGKHNKELLDRYLKN